MYQAEAPKLARFFRRRLPQSDHVKDFVQEVFMRFFRSSSTNMPGNPEAYLQRIARNLVFDTFRRTERGGGLTLVPLDEAESIAIPANQTEWLDAELVFRRYKSALAALPAKTKEVFLLHRVDELSYEQIAGRLGISVGAVKYHMTKALVHLDEALNHE
jgi:RNA polymerase sigma factor (sigma-70 family)